MTLTIKTKVSQENEIEIPCPFFARTKDQTEYIGLLDEKTIVKIFKGMSLRYVLNTERSDTHDHDLSVAYNGWVSCTEGEFLETFDAVIASISLHPKLAV